MNRPTRRPSATIPPDAPAGPFGPNSETVRRFLERAMLLSRRELVRLDLAERRDPDLLLAGWDHLRYRLHDPPLRGWRLAARNAAWDAVAAAAASADIEIPADDGYWRVEMGVGLGAARVVRANACALVAPERLDPEYLEVVVRPWRAAIGEEPG